MVVDREDATGSRCRSRVNVVISPFFLTPTTRRPGDPLTLVVVWLLAAMAVSV
jgi:hypothetical protein